MPLFQLIIALAFLGVVGWLIWVYVPMLQPIKIIIMCLIGLACIILLANGLGIADWNWHGNASNHLIN